MHSLISYTVVTVYNVQSTGFNFGASTSSGPSFGFGGSASSAAAPAFGASPGAILLRFCYTFVLGRSTPEPACLQSSEAQLRRFNMWVP